MKTYAVTVPEIAIVAATRGVAGAGIGLLVAGFLRPDTRRTLGWTLLTIGALTTIPIGMALFGKRYALQPWRVLVLPTNGGHLTKRFHRLER
jgi:hypothetical protein